MSRLAAINSPPDDAAGDVESLTGIERRLQHSRRVTRWLRGHYAFHSAQMDRFAPTCSKSLREIHPRREQIPLISTVTAARCRESLDALLVAVIREPVSFGPANGRDRRRGSHLCRNRPSSRSRKFNQGMSGRTRLLSAVFHSLRREADESDEGSPPTWRVCHCRHDHRLDGGQPGHRRGRATATLSVDSRTILVRIVWSRCDFALRPRFTALLGQRISRRVRRCCSI